MTMRNKLVAALAAAGLSTSAAAQSAALGEWSAPVHWDVIGVHAVALHTGKVLHFSYPEKGCPPGGPARCATSGASNAWVHELATLTGTKLLAPDDSFCCGHSVQPDGRVMVNGGNGTDTGLGYSKETFLLDPLTEAYEQAGDMNFARWYPTDVTLGDGSVLTMSGLDRNQVGFLLVKEIERYVPGVGWSVLEGAAKRIDIYPHLMLLPDGRVATAGPDRDTWFFEPATKTWTHSGQFGFGRRFQGNAVLLPPANDALLAIGGADNFFVEMQPATNTVEMLVTSSATPAWTSIASMNYPRSSAMPVLLPDGKILVVGGATESEITGHCPGETFAVLVPELYDPSAGTWSPMAPQALWRTYHSTAVLLPDGRVLSAGGDCQYEAELYSPPYLFRGSRPVIAGAPSEIAYGEGIDVSYASDDPIAQVSLVRPSVATHSVTMDQRLVALEHVERGPGVLRVSVESNPNLAPPGWDMLFLVDDDGVPSVATWVRLSQAPTLAGVVPAQLSVLGNPPVVLTGTGFETAQKVSVGPGTPLGPGEFAVDGPTQITLAELPPLASLGAGVVSVTNAQGTSAPVAIAVAPNDPPFLAAPSAIPASGTLALDWAGTPLEVSFLLFSAGGATAPVLGWSLLFPHTVHAVALLPASNGAVGITATYAGLPLGTLHLQVATLPASLDPLGLKTSAVQDVAIVP